MSGSHHGSTILGIRGIALLAASTLLLAACAGNYPISVPEDPAVTGAPSPVTEAGLRVLAAPVTVDGSTVLALHTTGGDITFWSGVNLGSTIPGHNPGELAATAEDYARWLQQMQEFGVRFLRIYTILPPAFYQEFAKHNAAHPDSPIYLIQGVYLPDESYIETGDLLDPETTKMFTEEIRDASAAVSGDLMRDPVRGRASGTWDTDVSEWLAGWVIGAELDPGGIDATNSAHAGAPAYHGTYFESVSASGLPTPTESWLAERMDELATAEATQGRSSPIAFVNWPTTDPLRHSAEANPREDLVSNDANHVRATKAWPGGTFASYHAYPYYPDFQRYQPEYQAFDHAGEADAYAGYLAALKAYHQEAGLATMVTEFGVPSSLGSAHYGTNGRDQGYHSEQEAMQMDASMLRTMRDIGLAGGLLFIWSDEWFKFTWNTSPRFGATDSERRALWHDPLTNEQFFGVMAQDPVPTGWRTPFEADTGITSVAINTDASYGYVRITFGEEPTAPVVIGFDLLPGGRQAPGAPATDSTSDIALVFDPGPPSLTAYVREEANPILLDGLVAEDLPPADLPGWSLQRMTASRSWPAQNGLPARSAEFYDIGRMVQGTWNVDDSAYDSRATWSWQDKTLDIRIPWSMLNVADPSSKTAFVPQDGVAAPVPFDVVKTSIWSPGMQPVTVDIAWEPWQRPTYAERMKVGADVLSQAMRDVAQPASASGS